MGKLIDLTNRNVGLWTVLRREKTEKSKYHYWRCKCECGFEKSFTSSHIQKTLKGGCGCTISLVGKKFNMLMPIERIAKTGYTNSKYLCLCDCGKKKILRARILTEIKQTSCGCAQIKGTEETGTRIAFTYYKRNAKRRKIGFSISKEIFKKLILSKCHYCKGDYTSKTKENYRTKKEIRVFCHNGIDRIDNKKGYTNENCVSCCSFCNLMKREMSIEEWIFRMEKVLANFKASFEMAEAIKLQNKQGSNSPPLAGANYG